jgi:hypothetical protein
MNLICKFQNAQNVKLLRYNTDKHRNSYGF